MDEARAKDTGRLGIAVGAVAAGTAVCLATYFVVSGPFGTFNDVGNAATGVLSGWLAWRLRRQVDSPAADAATGAALVGAAITVVGSALVVSGTTGFLYAGLVSSLGFAGIGAWLVVVNRSQAVAQRWPQALRRVGLVAGLLMMFGVVMVPGILLGLDDLATAPAWVWIGFVGWFGIYVAYPAWAIWMGIVETRLAAHARPVAAGSVVTE